MEIRLFTLGKAAVTLDGKEVAGLPGKPVNFGLLVYLGVEGSVTRDKAAAVFWPESDSERARASLSQTLYELNEELGEGWLDEQGNLLLTRDVLWVDANTFQHLVNEKRSEEAISLYKGPFLGGVYLAQARPFGEWVEHRRGDLRRMNRDAIETVIGNSRRKGQVSGALPLASEWVRMDPLCEAAQYHLIRLLGETGQRDEALAQYDRYTALLKEELGLDPLEETRDLARGIRTGGLRPALSKPVQAEEPTVPWTERGETEAAEPGSWPGPLSVEFDGNGIEARLRDRTELRKYVERELAPRLQVIRPIGRGSMADVYLARDPALRTLVAVKVLSPELSRNDRARERFRREAEAMAQLENHPNVCSVKWVGSLPNRTPFLVMPFIKGTTLGSRLKAEGRLNPGEVRVVLLEVASALAASHAAGIVHRDVRPDNILREETTNKNLLSDFGIAGVLESGDFGGPKVTVTGETLGHPAYISPEQMEDAPLTERSDIYSLGVTGYQLLTERAPPAEGAGSAGTGTQAARALAEYAERFDAIDRRLVQLIIRCLARNPAHRPTAADVERKLKEDERERIRQGTGPDPDPKPWELLWSKRLPHILGGYVGSAWLTLEFTKYLVEEGLLPSFAETLILVSLPFGFLVVTIFGWFHGMKGRQRMPLMEMWLLGVVGIAWMVAITLTAVAVGRP